jgi:F0F1-type ATP synthase beta subunit
MQEVFASKIGKSQDWLSQILIAYDSVVKLKQMGKPYKEFADIIKQIGMQELGKRISQLFEKLLRERPSEKINDPLPPEKIKRRDYLLDKGKKVGLTKDEANELKEILEEEAREAFTSGLIDALAFAGLLLFVGLLVASLSEK